MNNQLKGDNFSNFPLEPQMGPSGSGKTTMLDLLAGRKTQVRHVQTFHYQPRPTHALDTHHAWQSVGR